VNCGQDPNRALAATYDSAESHTESMLSPMVAEQMVHVTKMTRCPVCGMAFATAHPDTGTRLSCVETCPAGHDGHYDGGDYYFV
jgi:hypothetical protein